MIVNFVYMYGFLDTYTIVAQELLTLDALPDMSVVHSDLNVKTTPYPFYHVHFYAKFYTVIG